MSPRRTIRNGCSPLISGGIVTAGRKSPKCGEYCLTIYITGRDEPDPDSGRFGSDYRSTLRSGSLKYLSGKSPCAQISRRFASIFYKGGSRSPGRWLSLTGSRLILSRITQNLLEIVEPGNRKRSTFFCSQFDVTGWYLKIS